MTEQMQDNPFVAMVKNLRPPDNQTRIVPGTVLSASPLTINADGLTLSGNDLRINSMLLARNVPATMDGRNATAHFPAELTPGAAVLLLTEDGQTYYVLCKAVGA